MSDELGKIGNPQQKFQSGQQGLSKKNQRENKKSKKNYTEKDEFSPSANSLSIDYSKNPSLKKAIIEKNQRS